MITYKTILWYLLLTALLTAVYMESGVWTAATIALIAIRVELQKTAMWVLGRILHEQQILSKQDIERVVRGK